MSSPEGLSFTMKYIGFITVKPSGIGPGMVQKPLTELYLSYRKTSPKVQERHLTLTDRGLSIVCPSLNKEEHYAIPDIPFWHAVQFVTVKAKRDKYKGAFEPLDQEVVMNFENMYFDIDKKMNFITKLEHPAIFALVLRRSSGLRALDCHAYICESQDVAKGIAKGLSRIAKGFKDVAPGVFDYNPWSAPSERLPQKVNQNDIPHGHHERGSNESRDGLPGMRHASEGSSSTQQGTSPTNSQRRLRMASDPLPNPGVHHSPINHPITEATALLTNAQLGPSNNASETRRGVPIGITYPFPVTGGRDNYTSQLTRIESVGRENAQQNSNDMSNKNSNQAIITRNLEPQLQPEAKNENNVYVNLPFGSDLNSANTQRTNNIQELQNQGFISPSGEDQTVNLGQGYSFMGVGPHEPGYEDEDDGSTTPPHGARPQPIGQFPDHTYINTGAAQTTVNNNGPKSPMPYSPPRNDNVHPSGGMLNGDGNHGLNGAIPSQNQLQAFSPNAPRYTKITDNDGHGHFQFQARPTSEHYRGGTPSPSGVYTPMGYHHGIINSMGQPQSQFTPGMSRPHGQIYSPRNPGVHRGFTPNVQQDFTPRGYGPSGMTRTPVMPHFTPGPTRPPGKPFYKVQISDQPPPSPETDYWNHGRNGEINSQRAHDPNIGNEGPSYDSQYSTSPNYETSIYQEIPEPSAGGYLNYKTPHESGIPESSVKEKDINYEPFTDHMRVLESQRQQDRPIAKVTPHKIGGIRVLPKLPTGDVDTTPNPDFLKRNEAKRRSRSKSPASRVPVNALHSQRPHTKGEEETYFKNDMKKQSKQNKLAPKTSQTKYESNWQFGPKKKGNYVNQYQRDDTEGASSKDKFVGEKLLLNKKKDAEIASAISHLNVEDQVPRASENSHRFGTGLEESLGYLP